MDRSNQQGQPVGWRRFLLLFGCTLPLAVVVVWAALLPGPPEPLIGLDFRAFLTAGTIVAAGDGARLEDLSVQLAYQGRLWPTVVDRGWLLPFMTPPFVALASVPVAGLSPIPAYVVWTLGNAALLALLCHLGLGALDAAGQRTRLVAPVLVLTWFPVMVAMLQGQFSIVLALGFFLAWRAIVRGRPVSAGLALALLLVKPQMVLLPAAVLLWKRQWGVLAGLTMGGLAAGLASLAIVGPDGLVQYVMHILDDIQHPELYAARPELMQTWWGFLDLALAGRHGPVEQALRLGGAALALVGLGRLCAGRWVPQTVRFDLQWAGIILATVFTSPHLLIHDLSVLVVSGFLLARAADRLPSGNQYAVWLRGLTFSGYAACWVSLFVVQAAPIQVSVLFEAMALAVLVVVSSRTANLPDRAMDSVSTMDPGVAPRLPPVGQPRAPQTS